MRGLTEISRHSLSERGSTAIGQHVEVTGEYAL
jgi:hypothetical protein